MRFKIKKTPKLGDYRYKRRFAFIPKRVIVINGTEEYYIWLRFYTEVQQYIKSTIPQKNVWVTVESHINLKY